MTQYSITIPELIFRDIIRTDQDYEWMNKLTDDELIQLDQEIYAMLEDEGVKKVYPDWNAAYLSKTIDRDVLYNIFKEGKI